MTVDIHALCWQSPQTRSWWYKQTAPREGRLWRGPFPMWVHMEQDAQRHLRCYKINWTRTKFGPCTTANIDNSIVGTFKEVP